MYLSHQVNTPTLLDPIDRASFCLRNQVNSEYIASNDMVINKWWIGRNLEGSCCDIILKYFPGISLEGLRKNTKTSDRIPGLRAKIWTQDLPSAKQECWPLDHDVRYRVSYHAVPAIGLCGITQKLNGILLPSLSEAKLWFYRLFLCSFWVPTISRVAQSVQCLTTDWTTGRSRFDPR
jgi:hypothetical protein